MEAIEGLTRLGFSEYEAKAYLALLDRNPATGYDVSKRSGVPRSMVYETLNKLERRGAVMETVEERATYYRPVPPQLYLDRQEQDQQKLFASLREELQEIHSKSSQSGIWTIRGESAVLTYAQQMIREAQEDIFLVLADDHLRELSPSIQSACDREIIVSALLTGMEELGCGQTAHHPPLESEMQELTGTLLIVVDGERALIAGRERELSAAVTQDRNLVLICRQFVWMEMFAHRIYAKLTPDMLQLLDPEDREIFASFGRRLEGTS